MIKIELASMHTELTDAQYKAFEDNYLGGTQLSEQERIDLNRSVNLILKSDWIYRVEKKGAHFQQKEGRRIGDWISPNEVSATLFDVSDKSGRTYEEFMDDVAFMEKTEWYQNVQKHVGPGKNYIDLFIEDPVFNFIMKDEEYKGNQLTMLTTMQVAGISFANRGGLAGRNGTKTNQYNGKLVENAIGYTIQKVTGEEQGVITELTNPANRRRGHDGGIDISIDGIGIDVKSAYRNRSGNKGFEANVSATQLKDKNLKGAAHLMFAEYIGDENVINIIGIESKNKVREHWILSDKLSELNYVGFNGEVPMSTHDVYSSPYALLSQQINSIDDLVVRPDDELDNPDVVKLIKYQDPLFNRADKEVVDSFYKSIKDIDVPVYVVDFNDIVKSESPEQIGRKVVRAPQSHQMQYNRVAAICHAGNSERNHILRENGQNSLSRLLLRAGTQQEQLGWKHESDTLRPLKEIIKEDLGIDKDIIIPGQDFFIKSVENGETIVQIAEKVATPRLYEFLDLIHTDIPFKSPGQYIGDYLVLQDKVQHLSFEIIKELQEREYWDGEFVEFHQVAEFREDMEQNFIKHGMIDEYHSIVEPEFLERQLEESSRALLLAIVSDKNLKYDSLDYSSNTSAKPNPLSRIYDRNRDINHDIKAEKEAKFLEGAESIQKTEKEENVKKTKRSDSHER